MKATQHTESARMASDTPCCPATTIRTEETRSLLRTIDGILRQWHELPFRDTLDSSALEQIRRDIDRARRQFDAKLFFVVVFGPLKAGKSTLTNALAGEYVSPAGFGKETTRRPSLVVQAAESGIDQYFSTDPDVNHALSQRRVGRDVVGIPPGEDKKLQVAKVREAFDAVADYLRGIRSKDEFQGRIRVSTLPLNGPLLEKSLTQNLATEPLLTVIRCKGGHLLSKGVAIVDMPGLDGSRSNWRDDPIHEWVINRAEFFLFVQSSVAALNNETQAFLREVVAQSTKPPIWLIQNIFDARYWLPEDKRRKDAADQQEEGRKRVVELLNEAPRAALGFNVGLAWDGKNEAQDEWLAKSEFPSFEANLASVLHGERAMIQEKNCLKNLHQRIDQSTEALKQCETSLKEIRINHDRVREKLRAAQGLLDSVQYRTAWESAVRGEVSTIAEKAAEPWLESLRNETVRLKERHNRTRTGKKVNDDLAVLAVKLAEDGSTKYFAKSLLLPDYVRIVNQFGKAADSDAVNDCNRILTSLDFAELLPALSPSTDDLPSLMDDAFQEDKLQESPRWWPWWKKEYDGGPIQSHLEAMAKQWTQQIHARKASWVNTLLSEHFSTYCEKRRKHFRAHVDRLLADFESRARGKEEAATATETILSRMIGGLRDFELPLANAIASMK